MQIIYSILKAMSGKWVMWEFLDLSSDTVKNSN